MSRLSRLASFQPANDDISAEMSANAPRRAGHGDTAYTSAAGSMKQPQDGAPRNEHPSYESVPAMVREPEDARLTGLTRSLGRRLMGLNFMSPLRKGPAVKLAAMPKAKNLPAA